MPSILENTLRIKVTGKCNRKCSFCHEEGGMSDIYDIAYSEELKTIVNLFHDELGINSIALTGGEPLMHDSLYDFIMQINNNSKVHRFSLTTNGTITKDFDYWLAFNEIGLYKVNVSMPDIIEFQNYTSKDKLVEDVFFGQTKLVSILNKIGIETKINIVIFNDVLFTKNNIAKLLHFRDTLDSEIVLLPNLNSPESFAYSQKVIDVLRSDMRLKKIESRRRPGTSNSIEIYRDNNGDEDGKTIYIKSTKLDDGNPYRPDSLCGKCNIRKFCQEGFYGIRLESSQERLLIRLCIHKSSSDVLMPVDDFIESSVYKELKAVWSENK